MRDRWKTTYLYKFTLDLMNHLLNVGFYIKVSGQHPFLALDVSRAEENVKLETPQRPKLRVTSSPDAGILSEE